LIVSFDLIGLPGEYCKKLKNKINKYFKISVSKIVLCWTHTHTAPTTINFKNRYFVSHIFFDMLTAMTLKAIEKSFADTEKCESISYKRDTVDLVVNRIEVGRINKINSLTSKSGNVLNELNIVYFRRTDSKIIALLNYPCHNLGITEKAEQILSGDFTGYAENYLNSAGIKSIFLQGFSGNLNPKIHGDIGKSKEIAHILANGVIKNINRSILPETDNILMKSKDILLDTLNGKSIIIKIQILKIGNIIFLFSPGEPFFEIYLKVKDRIDKSENLFLIPIGYANNGSIGYIPDKKYYNKKEAYYETVENYYWYQTPVLGPNSAEKIIDGFIDLIGNIE